MLTGKDLEGSSHKALSQIMPDDLRKTPKAHRVIESLVENTLGI
jgi:hypothetical protein